MEIKFNVLGKKHLGTLYKDNCIDVSGRIFIVDIDLREVNGMFARFSINGGKKCITDKVDIVDVEGGVIRVPFSTSVVKVGTHELEIIASMKNGGVKASQTYIYTIEKSLEAEDSIEAETNYPILIKLLQDVDFKIKEVDDSIDEIKDTINSQIEIASESLKNDIQEASNSLGDSFEEYKNEADMKINLINEDVKGVFDRQDNLETTFNQLIIDVESSNSEIVDARVEKKGKAYEKLGDRLDSIDSQLEQKANKTEISQSMNFLGAKKTSEISSTRANNGDYYYSSDERVYYMYSPTGWVQIGSGNNLDKVLSTYQLVIENRYLNKSGGFSNISNNNFKTIEIPVVPGERFLINATYRDSQRMYSFVDIDNKVLELYPSTTENLPQTTESILVTIPNGAVKLRAGTYGIGTVVKCPVIDVDGELVKNVENNTSTLSSMIKKINPEIVTGTYINERGNIIAQNVGKAFETCEVEVKKGEVFILSGQYCDSSRLYSIKNFKNEVVEVFPNSDEKLEVTFITDKYVTMPCDGVLTIGNYSANNKSIKIKKLNFSVCSEGDKQQEVTSAKSINYNLLLNKVMCIGDSLTMGAYYSTENNGVSIKENYPYYFSKINQLEVTNAGQSGYSPSGWYNKKRELFDIASHDTFIIWLGTNLGLTDTLDIDTVGGDYNSYAETETGYYCRIIENIKELRPDANIFMCNIFASSGDLSVTNTVLEKIAARYSLPLFDMNDGSIYKGENHDILHPFGNAVHFGKFGNITVANKISDYINNYIKDNSSQFEKIYIK